MSVRRAIVSSYIEKYAALAVAIVSTMILARLLTPEEIGTFSVAAVLAGFAGTLRDMGAGTFIVRQAALTPSQIRSAFGVALLIGIAFACLFAVASPFIAQLFGNSSVKTVLLLLALNFCIVPFGSVTLALLVREMRFGAIATINLASALTNTVVSVALALRGFGPLSLAWAAVAAALVSALMTGLYRPRGTPWLPSLTDSRQILSFGSRASGGELVNQLANNLPDLIVGRVQGLEMAGLYGRARSFVTLFQDAVMRALWPLALPYFSSQLRAERAIEDAFFRVTTYVTSVGWTVLGFMAIAAFPMMRVLFGPQWDAAVDPARILCLSGFAGLLTAFGGHALTAVGAVAALFRYQVVAAIGKTAFVLAGIGYGLLGVTGGLLAWSLVGLVLLMRLLRREADLGFARYRSVILQSGAVACVALAPAVVLVALRFDEAYPLAFLIVAALLVGVSWIGAVVVLRHPLHEELRSGWKAVRARFRNQP